MLIYIATALIPDEMLPSGGNLKREQTKRSVSGFVDIVHFLKFIFIIRSVISMYLSCSPNSGEVTSLKPKDGIEYSFSQARDKLPQIIMSSKTLPVISFAILQSATSLLAIQAQFHNEYETNLCNDFTWRCDND